MSVVVITGCSSGFGMEGALAFARNGDTVYATMRDPGRATELLEATTRENLVLQVAELDVTRPDTFPAFINSVAAESGSVDVLVNNAGILRAGAFEDLTEQAFRDVLETNYVGPMLLARSVLPQMRTQGDGYIINISSLSGIAGLAGDVAYTGSKFAVEGATEALRHEVDRWGIKVALVQAALYATRIFSPSLPDDSPLPDDYPKDSPYKSFVEVRLNEIRQKMDDALHPRVVGKLLVRIAGSDGSKLRWPADELSKMVLAKMHGQDDLERDAFLRGAAGSDWWSAGRDVPDQ
jgi:NAD(P)-dependent dehydrogenase (short-subunit alcohol dehydrogenase family)